MNAPGLGDPGGALPTGDELKLAAEVQVAESAGAADSAEAEAAQFELTAQKGRLAEELASRKQDREERKAVGGRLVTLVQAWLIGVFLILFWQGFGSRIGFFGLSDGVLKTLLVTTTANLIGLLFVIARYLYNEKRIPQDNGQNHR